MCHRSLSSIDTSFISTTLSPFSAIKLTVINIFFFIFWTFIFLIHCIEWKSIYLRTANEIHNQHKFKNDIILYWHYKCCITPSDVQWLALQFHFLYFYETNTSFRRWTPSVVFWDTFFFILNLCLLTTKLLHVLWHWLLLSPLHSQFF